MASKVSDQGGETPKTGDEKATVAKPSRRSRNKVTGAAAASKPASKPATTRRKAASGDAATTKAEPAKKPAPRRRAKPAQPAATAEKPAQQIKTDALTAATQALTQAPPAMMADAADVVPSHARKMVENIERIETLGQRLVNALAEKSMPTPAVEGPGPDLYMAAANAFMKTMTGQPAKMIENQVSYWSETLKNYADAQAALARGQFTAPEDDGGTDKRFSNPLWQTHPYFNLIKKQYLTNARALKEAAEGLELDDAIARRRINWMTNQIIDMMAPTNFLATNPDALERAIETEGESLVRGLENLVRDVEQAGGEMVVSLADRDAFTVGENIGVSEGSVVHRAPLFELIQYKPLTDQVHALPIVIFPPWINKFYILDLKPQNSLIKWLVEQGHTVFIASWKNPDASMGDMGMDDYISAYLDAMDQVLTLTGQKKLNAVGYCIGGTTLTLTLALMAQRGDDRVNCATFFTTLTDFSDQGEFVPFLQGDVIGGIAEDVRRHGLMRAHLMTRTMSFLRANDLVWGPAIRSYMLGETPPAFDLLYWNGDSTNLPGRMAVEYLRGLCQDNALVGQGFDVMGHTLRISDVTLPVCSVACETDHIAPWKSCWIGFSQLGSTDKTFILSESGHIAGIVNPPSKKKYGHYEGGDGFDNGWQAWRESATFHDGSWWPLWGEWLAGRAGKMVAARDPGAGLEPAPGSYVHERAS